MCVSKEELFCSGDSNGKEHLLQALQNLSGLLASHDMNRRAYWLPSAVLVLKGLSLNGGSSAADLSTLGLSQRTLYRALDRLEDLSLIEREGQIKHHGDCRGRKPATIWRIKST